MYTIQQLLDTVNFNPPTGARALVISGEMGIGKTRLLTELCRVAGERGFRVLEARATMSDTSIPYQPIIQALRPLLWNASPEQLRYFLGIESDFTHWEPDDQDDANRQTPRGAHHEQAVALVHTGASLVFDLAQLFPDLPAMLPLPQTNGGQQTGLLSAEKEKFRVFDAVASLLERVAEEQPVLFCIDNLHWIDNASLDLLLYVIVRLRQRRVGFVGVTRALKIQALLNNDLEAQRTVFSEKLRYLIRNKYIAFVAVGPLTRVEAARYLKSLLPGKLPAEVARTLLERAKGNPFFLEELAQTCYFSHQLRFHEGSWSRTDSRKLSLPESSISAVKQRLSWLSKECYDALSAAALIGFSFSVEVLARVTERDLDDLTALLDEAEAKVFITRQQISDEGKSSLGEEHRHYSFCNDTVYEALYNSVPVPKAQNLHRLIGIALEHDYTQQVVGHSARLAQHFGLYSTQIVALHWNMRAGEEAARQHAHGEAIGYFRLVIKLLEAQKGPDSLGEDLRLAGLYITVGELYLALGEAAQALIQLQAALQRLPQIRDDVYLDHVRIHRLLTDTHRLLLQYDKALAHMQIASDMLAARPPKKIEAESSNSQNDSYPGPVPAGYRIQGSRGSNATLEAMRVFQAQGVLYIALNKPKEAEGALWQLHQFALEMGDLGSQAFALQMVGYLRSWGEQIHESVSLQERAVNLYITVGNPFRAAVLEQMLGASYLVLGDMELADIYIQRGLERAKLYGVRQRIGWFYWTQAGIAGNQGDWEEGLSYLKMALREAEAIKEVRLKPLILVAKAMLLFKRGDWIEAEDLFLESCQAAVAVDWYPCTLALYGYFLAVTGRQTEALVQLDRAASLPPPRGTVGRFYFPFLAEGYLHLGLEELVEFYLQYIRTLHGFIYYGNSVDRILGIIFAHKGDWETADYYFEEGLALCRRANLHPEQAAILYEQARVAVLRCLPLQHIAALCEQARAIFLRYNMRRAVAMVDTLYNGARQLEHQGGISLNAQAPTFSRMIPSEPLLSEVLTKRELDVLRLITSGHSDREVVKCLHLTPRTVNRHLSNIFAKLEVTDRNAAVACAIRFGL